MLTEADASKPPFEQSIMVSPILLVLGALSLAQSPIYQFTTSSSNQQVDKYTVTYDSNGYIQLFGGHVVRAIFADGGLQQVNTSQYVYEDSDGTMLMSSTGHGGFNIVNGTLTLNGENNFVVCPILDYSIFFYEPELEFQCENAIKADILATRVE